MILQVSCNMLNKALKLENPIRFDKEECPNKWNLKVNPLQQKSSFKTFHFDCNLNPNVDLRLPRLHPSYVTVWGVDPVYYCYIWGTNWALKHKYRLITPLQKWPYKWVVHWGLFHPYKWSSNSPYFPNWFSGAHLVGALESLEFFRRVAGPTSVVAGNWKPPDL